MGQEGLGLGGEGHSGVFHAGGRENQESERRRKDSERKGRGEKERTRIDNEREGRGENERTRNDKEWKGRGEKGTVRMSESERARD